MAPIAGAIIPAFTDWSGVFLVLSCIGVVLVLMVSWKIEEALPEEKRVPSDFSQVVKNFGSLFRDREFTGYAFTQGLIVAGIFAYVSGIPFVYQNIYGVISASIQSIIWSKWRALIIGSQLVGN
ncbi:MAG: Bcr/CflA family drug resistance efflux transporter [Neobacillus sp.]|nr:Bcr/CflA family drug resistance efflux transporter [Neobacillus sp.]